ncbi:hypothetical protein [Desulfoluna spongiiphila]|uniref:hypothetical protein n=1 Tax=Desulfoluna spongiiphila TaxID=419481 RepID=UPI00125EF79F|nr:hypothetical protein [Desulfoluna spongiiphila]
MAIFKIEPIAVMTEKGYHAEITGIDSNDSDCIVGTIKGKYPCDVCWDLNGLCRDNESGCNLNTTTDEFLDVKRAASLLLKK